MLLENARSANNGGVITCFRQELQSDGKILVGETAGHGKSGESAKISDTAERVRKSEIGFEIGFERRCADGLRSCHENVERVEHVGHFLLQNVAHLQRTNVVRAAELFADVAVDLAEWIGELRNLAGTDEFAKGGYTFDGNNQSASVFKRAFRETGVSGAGEKLADAAFSSLQRFFRVRIEFFPRVGEPADAQRLRGKFH